MKKIFLALLFIGLSFRALLCLALELPVPDTFTIKQIDTQKILYVQHTDNDGYISNSVVRLVQYYLYNADESYEVTFPQMSIERDDIQGSYVAIGYTGNPPETNTVKTGILDGGLMASYVYKGSYTQLGQAIRTVFRKVADSGEYLPAANGEVRLLYWNSIDDNKPEELITEIQIKIEKLGILR
jgi:effector-binding domain-containing protein